MTGLLQYENNQVTFKGLVRDGVQGNLEVLWHMMDVVRDTTVKDKGFEDLAKQIEIESGNDSYSDTDKLLSTIYDFVKQHVKYLQDIYGKTESIKDARTTLRDGYGDCDDNAILTASFLAVLGFEPYFVIAKYPEATAFQHVYTVTYVNGKRYVFDTTIENGKLNDEYENTIKEEFPIFQDRPEMEGLQSAFRNFKYLALGTKKNIEQTAPLLSGFLPLFGGFIEKTLARSAFSGLSDSQSLNELGSEISGKIHNAYIDLQNGRITKQQASSIAHDAYSKLFAYPNHNDENFIAIEKISKAKLDYIDNFVPYGTQPIATESIPNLNKYLFYGALGFTAYYFFKD